jgi:SEC-C motif domain protein
MSNTKTPCPCGLSASLEGCCGRYHAGEPAPTPEALMRSRYSAYALGLTDYVRATWHASTRPAELDLAPPQPRWIGLKIVAAANQDDAHGTVEFVARYRSGGKAQFMHERSRFVREDGRWFYIDGYVM